MLAVTNAKELPKHYLCRFRKIDSAVSYFSFSVMYVNNNLARGLNHTTTEPRLKLWKADRTRVAGCALF